MGNGQYSSRTRKRDNWYYLDQLPSELRLALCHAAFTWDAKYFLDKWNRGTHSIPALIREIKAADERLAAKRIPYRKPGGILWKHLKTAYADKATRVRVLYPEGM